MTDTSNPLDALNEAVRTMGGRWVKLRHTTDPPISGEILDFQQRPMSWEGKPVLSQRTGQPRMEWVFILRTQLHEDDEDDGVRRLPANESMQRAIAQAIKDAGGNAEIGGRLQVAVVADAPSATDQADYKARYTAPEPAPKSVSADDIFGEGF